MTPITKAEALAILHEAKGAFSWDTTLRSDECHSLRAYIAASIDPQEVRRLRTWPSGISGTLYYTHEVLALSTPLPEPEPPAYVRPSDKSRWSKTKTGMWMSDRWKGATFDVPPLLTYADVLALVAYVEDIDRAAQEGR